MCHQRLAQRGSRGVKILADQSKKDTLLGW
jgi:hypothetical protein